MARYTLEIQSMMYTFGDVRIPLPASAQLVEQIVRKQLVEMIIKTCHVAMNVRGGRGIIPEDVLFVVRKDPVKLARLREFLGWKELRKNARTGEDPSGTILDAGANDEVLSLVNGLEVTAGDSAAIDGLGKGLKALRTKTVRLPWDYLSSIVAEAGGDVEYLEIEEVEPEVEADMTKRLSTADQMTREMSREEYMEYSECRQSSFTYKKTKKFRDWLNAAQFIEQKLNDDVIEILGFLAWEMVRKLTEEALKVRLVPKKSAKIAKKAGCDLFSAGQFEKTGIMPEHIHEALAAMEWENRSPFICLTLQNKLWSI